MTTTTRPSRAAHTHEYQCVACGLRVRGRELPDGRVVPSNSIAADGEPRRCVCWACSEAGA